MPIIIIIAANLNAVQRTRIEDFRDKRKFPRPSKYKKKKKKKNQKKKKKKKKKKSWGTWGIWVFLSKSWRKYMNKELNKTLKVLLKKKIAQLMPPNHNDGENKISKIVHK